MKLIKIISVLLLFACHLNAQTFNKKTTGKNISSTRGAGSAVSGVYLPIGYVQATTCILFQNTVTPLSSPTGLKGDTLVSIGTSDSLYYQFGFNSLVGKMFNFEYTNLTGTAGGTAILQGSFDNSSWHTLTGNTTICTDCIGASATISGSGTTRYVWNIKAEDEIFTYHQVRVIQTGTCTATATAFMNVAY